MRVLGFDWLAAQPDASAFGLQNSEPTALAAGRAAFDWLATLAGF